MHEWDHVTTRTDATSVGGNFRAAEQWFHAGQSNDGQMKPAASVHDAGASKGKPSPMNPAQKALWYIESHLAGPLTLDDVATIAGVSRFHIVRAFASATGYSVMRYVRARRLTKAAQALAAGAPDILSLALDADYSSHEAFTRAFRDHFGVTPETVRAATCLGHLKLQEPIVMISTALDHLKAPRFETSKPLLVAGIGERCTHENQGAGIPGQWQRFSQTVDNIPGRIGKVAYGVCCNADDAGSFDYIAGVEVTDFSDLPREFQSSGFPSRNTPCLPRPSTSRPFAAPSTRSGITGCRSRA